MNYELANNTQFLSLQMEKLRAENDEKWKILKDLHLRLYSEQTSVQPLIESFQAELALLPRSAAAKDCDELLESATSATVSVRSVEHFEADLVKSYRELMATNKILERSISIAQSQSHDIKAACSDQHKILQTLVSIEQMEVCTRKRSTARKSSREDNLAVPAPASEAGEVAEDLRYICQLVEDSICSNPQRKLRNNNRQQSDDESALYDFVRTLVKKCSSKRGTAYLPIDDDTINPDLMCFLRRLFLIESPDDDDSFVKLVE